MKIANKELGWYMNIITVPVLLIILWAFTATVLDILVLLYLHSIIVSTFVWIVGVIIGILIGIYVGWTTIRKYNGDLSNAAVAGALTGFISNMIGGIIDISGAIILIIVIGGDSLARIGGGLPLAEFIGVVVGLILTIILSIIISPILGIILGIISAVIGGFIAQNI